MATQTTISQYFNVRKRPAEDSNKIQSSKVLIIENDGVSSPSGDEIIRSKKCKSIGGGEKGANAKRVVLTPTSYHPKKTPQFSSIRLSVKKARALSASRSTAKKRLFSKIDTDSGSDRTVSPEPLDTEVTASKRKDKQEPQSDEPEDVKEAPAAEIAPSSDAPAAEIAPSSEAPAAEIAPSSEAPAAEIAPTSSEAPASDIAATSSKAQDAPKLTTLDSCNSLREELGLGQLKAKLSRSGRLAEIKNALNRINAGYEGLAALQKKDLSKSPSLKKFDTIELEVPCSPVKSIREPDVFMSPSKSNLRDAFFRSPAKAPNSIPYVSPRKFFEENKPSSSVAVQRPAYERYNSLAAATGKPCLPLPYSYKFLGEIFRAVEVVSSMLYNRKETITFNKLKHSSQELTRKSLCEHHLGQILTVFPGAFTLSYEKIKQHGTSKPDKCELVLHPVLKEPDSFGPSEQLERRRAFFNTLVEITKNHHEKYLLSLDPPLVVDKDKLTRWHPGFNLDCCPDVKASPLPEPPAQETYSSAKHLLGKAKEMYMSNPRMEKALSKLSECQSNTTTGGQPTAASVAPGLANALKGIPKALLEKVRAKQAAKAVELLTRDPKKTKLKIDLGRLPEIARIMRHLFVVEKRNVLDRPFILDKIKSSYREILSPEEMNRMLTLLIDTTPGWLTVTKYGHIDYIRMNKDIDMSVISDAIKRALEKA